MSHDDVALQLGSHKGKSVSEKLPGTERLSKPRVQRMLNTELKVVNAKKFPSAASQTDVKPATVTLVWPPLYHGH